MYPMTMQDPPVCEPPELVAWVASHAISQAADTAVLAEQLACNRPVVRAWLFAKRKSFATAVCHERGISHHIGHIDYFLTAVLEEWC